MQYEKKNEKIEKTLQKWKDYSFEDFSLAKHICFGVCRQKITLDFYSKQIAKKLKIKERILLWMSLYQIFFLKKIPFYAIASESVEIAKLCISEKTAAFFHFIFSNFSTFTFKEPENEDWVHRYSYPDFFIQKLLKQYKKKTIQNMLEQMNQPGKLFLRGRDKQFTEKQAKLVYENQSTVYELENGKNLESLVKNPFCYFQNITSVYLYEKLNEKTQIEPRNILDLCTGKGGKLILSHDLYPKAKLFANDISSKQIPFLKENLEKYKIEAKISQKPIEDLEFSETFDLILLDVPCSNSGVLNKRCEARWNLYEENIKNLVKIQQCVLKEAKRFLHPDGEIWYTTCSILQEENEDMINFAEKIGFVVQRKVKVLPNEKGWEGGFGVVFSFGSKEVL